MEKKIITISREFGTGGRTIGKICGQYDEFFFAADEPPTKSGTVYHKDYVATTAGKTLLEQEAPQADTW